MTLTLGQSDSSIAALAACQQPLEATRKKQGRKTSRHQVCIVRTDVHTSPSAVRLHYQPLHCAVYMDTTLKPGSGSKAPHGHEQPRLQEAVHAHGAGQQQGACIKAAPVPLDVAMSIVRMGTMSTSTNTSSFPGATTVSHSILPDADT